MMTYFLCFLTLFFSYLCYHYHYNDDNGNDGKCFMMSTLNHQSNICTYKQ